MTSITKYLFATIVFLALSFLSAATKPCMAAKVSVRAAVESDQVFVGESFIFQIQVEGHDAPEEPVLSGIEEFAVQPLGGQQNSSSSITVINGKMTRHEKLGYLFNYRLTAKRAGDLTIPSIEVSAGGQTVRTKPISIKAMKPAETEDFKLRMEVSQERCYVGQPITLTVTWYIGGNVEGFQFGLPVIMDSRFDIADLDPSIDPHQKDKYLRIPLGDREAIGVKGRRTLEGKEYLAVTFQKVLIPKESGTLKIPQGTVAFNAVMGYRDRQRSRFPFDDDFFFGRGRQAIHKKLVIPSNEPVLTVLDLPTSGRPDNFSGLVGEYMIKASATPTDVRVGDPITLTIQVTGPDYLDQVELPSLNRQATLARDFKIPEEMAPGKVEEGVKTFTQTIRAKHADVKAIPPIELPYFDAKRGEYAFAKSSPIPLTVQSTRVVTAGDAEGRATVEEAKVEIETWTEGIAHNYEDLSVIKDRSHGPAMWLRSPTWMALIGLPPLIYLGLAASTSVIRSRRSDPGARQARRAHGELMRALGEIARNRFSEPTEIYDSVLAAFRQYFGSKLHTPPGALTYNDVERILGERGADGELLERLKALFDECEATRFAGGGRAQGREDHSLLVERAMSLAKDLEQSLK